MRPVRSFAHLIPIFPWFLISALNIKNNNSNNLYRTLLDDSKYNADIRPCLDCTTPLYIGIAFHLTALNKIDEIEGELNTVGYLKVVWVDERLTWNPMSNGVGSIMLPPRKIWAPPIILGNPSKAVSRLNADDALARVLYNGTVIWTPGDVFRSRCEFDVYNYPFDEQRCWIVFTPWAYIADEITLTPADSQIHTPFYQENGEWKLGLTSVSAYVTDGISLIQFDIHFVRRSEFFVVNIILPISFLSFLNCLAFAIPVESGERLSYSVTILLSFAVFMTLVSHNIPKTSAPMSLLCYFLTSLFSGSVLIMVSVMLNMRIFYKDSAIEVSSAYVRISKILKCCQTRKPSLKVGTESTTHENHPDVYMCTSTETEPNITWRHVAAAFDRLAFVVCVVYFMCITTGMVFYTASSKF